MDKYPTNFVGLWPFAKALGLAWPVKYFFVPTESTCRITSDPMKCWHEIWVHAGVIKEPDAYLCDIVHELCHAALAERIDPAFATIFFSSRYNNLAGKKQQRFTVKANWLYLSWAHVDVWVDELRHTFFPELTMADRSSFYASVNGIANQVQNPRTILETPESLLAIAVQLAETQRLGLDKQDFSNVLNCLTRNGQKTISRMSQHYAVLPRLTFQPEKDVAILEDSVQVTAKKLILPIGPKIIKEDGRRVWLF